MFGTKLELKCPQTKIGSLTLQMYVQPDMLLQTQNYFSTSYIQFHTKNFFNRFTVWQE